MGDIMRTERAAMAASRTDVMRDGAAGEADVQTPGYTDEQILSAIRKAIAAHDIAGAAGLIHMLAAQAPDKAQVLLDGIRGEA